MSELKKASDGDSGFGEAGDGRDGKAGKGGVGVKGHTKLLYVTPEMLVKNGKLASALEALACRCCEECVAMKCSKELDGSLLALGVDYVHLLNYFIFVTFIHHALTFPF